MEIRTIKGHLEKKGKTLVGYAAKYDVEAKINEEFSEVIRSGTFSQSLKSDGNIRALYHHQPDAILGTTRAKTLRLSEDESGLRFELDLPETTTGKDLAVLVERGDVAGCSFGFRVKDNGDRWTQRDNGYLRELLDVDLHEITLTADPAYQDTTVALRSKDLIANGINLDPFRLYLETL